MLPSEITKIGHPWAEPAVWDTPVRKLVSGLRSEVTEPTRWSFIKEWWSEAMRAAGLHAGAKSYGKPRESWVDKPDNPDD
jgi:hypothetical protein